LFAQTNNKTFDAEIIYATFFSEEPIQNHDFIYGQPYQQTICGKTVRVGRE
jgi:hypothetical protein